MSIQHFNEAKQLARTANTIGAGLPKRITNGLDHLEDLTRNAPSPLRPGPLAAELAQHIGNPAAMDKALKAAADQLAASEARVKIHTFLAETCGTRIRSMMRHHAEEIADSFGTALAADLSTLTETAPLLPPWFTENQAANLDPDTFEAWTRARDAYARISSASAALTPLYAAAIGTEHAGQFPRVEATSLRFSAPPKFASHREAYAFRDALAGRTERVQGRSGQGATFVDGLFIPSALVQVGARFEWATPAEVTERAACVVAGMTKREPVRV